MNKALSNLEKFQAHFLQMKEDFQKSYEHHRQYLAQVQDFLEVEELICHELLEQIHMHLLVERLVLSIETLRLKSGEVYGLPDGTHYIALRKCAGSYLLYARETGFKVAALYEVNEWGTVVPRFNEGKAWRVEELTPTSEIYFPQLSLESG